MYGIIIIIIIGQKADQQFNSYMSITVGIRTEWRHTVAIQCISPFRAFSTLYGDKGSDYKSNEF